jgi:hypothetical protein
MGVFKEGALLGFLALSILPLIAGVAFWIKLDKLK